MHIPIQEKEELNLNLNKYENEIKIIEKSIIN